MDIFGVWSMIVYTITLFFMGYCDKYMMETPYADLCRIVSLLLLLTGAVLAGLQDLEYRSPAQIKKWEKELKELEMELERRKLQLKGEK